MAEITTEALYRAISEAPNGLGIDAISGQFREQGSRRTLQRKLESIINSFNFERLLLLAFPLGK